MLLNFDFSTLPRSSIELAQDIATKHMDRDRVFFLAVSDVTRDELYRRDGYQQIHPRLSWPVDRYSGDQLVALGATATVLHHEVVKWCQNESDPAPRETWAALSTLTAKILEYFVDRTCDFDQAQITIDNATRH